MIDNDALRDLQDRFHKDFPKFRSFVEPGERFVARETGYKRQLSREFQTLVESTLKQESVEADAFVNGLQDILTRPIDGSTHPQNLTNWRENQTLFKVLEQPDRRGEFADLVQRLLRHADEREPLAGVIDEFADWCRGAGIRAGSSKVWLSLFLFLWRPEAHMYIKPTFFDDVLGRLSVKTLGHGRYLKGREYLRVRDVMEAVKGGLAEWQPQDMVDVQSFLWAALTADQHASDDAATERDACVQIDALRPRNEILYGPPGTGKTYALKQRQGEYAEKPERVDRNIWLQGMVGELRWREVVALALLDAEPAGMSVGDMAQQDVVLARAAVSGSGARNLRARLWGVLQMHADPDCEGVSLSRRNPPHWFWKESNSRWRLVEGWDETDEIVRATRERIRRGPQTENERVRRYEFVTFHQSYSYEDFVEGIRPVVDEESDGLRYELRHGVFRSLSERARRDPENRYALFIDEINRGNVSRIFGELISLLEPDKREGAEQAVSVRLPYSGDEFSVPPNLDVIGTMNTADRSLTHLDAALRRRFQFLEMEPTPSSVSRELVVGDELIDGQALLTRMNERIEALYDRDHRIGHSYFLQDVDLPRIFERQVLPLLAEYFFEDWARIRLILGDNLADDDTAQFITVKECDLGGEAQDIGRQQVFRLNPDALENPEAYRKIYDAPRTDV